MRISVATKDPSVALKAAIDARTDELVREHGVGPARVYSVLKSASHRIWPLRGKKNPIWLVAWPRVDEALRYLSADRALELFEGGTDALERRAALFDYLHTYETPLHSLKELGQLTESFIPVLQRNKQELIDTGLPRTTFAPCWWLCQHVNRIYYVYEDESSDRSDLPRSTTWNDSRNPWTDDDNMWFDPWIAVVLRQDVAERDLDILKHVRGKLFDLRMHLLNELYRAIRKQDVETLWPCCWSLFTEGLNKGDVGFCLRMDRLYIMPGSDTLQGPVAAYGYTGGGLIDLLLVIGHFEKEIALETLARTRERLGELVTFDSRNRRSMAFRSYFEVVDKPEQGIVDAACEVYQALAPQEHAFWLRYRERVEKAMLSCFDSADGFTPRELGLPGSQTGQAKRSLPGGVASLDSVPGLPNETVFRHSPDFRTVWLRGERFPLTPLQAAVVRELFQAHSDGTPDLSQDHILPKVESTSSRLRDVFRSRPGAWKALIRHGDGRGMFRLNL